mgnify:CR=1 FL=1
MIIIFRTDGGKAKEIGTGHITKTLLLASAIKERPFFEGSEIIFATRNDKTYVFGKERIDEAGYKHLDMTLSETNTITEKNILTSVRPDLVIFDRLCTSKSLVEGLKSKGIKVITFDDEGDGDFDDAEPQEPAGNKDDEADEGEDDGDEGEDDGEVDDFLDDV